MGWQEIHQLQEEGVVFGSHSLNHPSLLGHSCAEVVRLGVGAHAALERELGRPVTAFAYPFGKEDRIVECLMGACGYIFGLTSQASLARFSDSLLALPRIEVSGSGDLEQFITRLVRFDDR